MTGNVRMMLVGGFLGAGKTTLLWQCAERLLQRGQRVGLITNDQAPDLVDTHLLRARGVAVGEVAGSCFCCNFPALMAAAEDVQRDAGGGAADVLIAEPVGSCTDLSATIVQPLKDRYRDRFTVSPLTVVADPARLREVLSKSGDTLHADASYIFRKQLEEADVIAINKVDTLDQVERVDLSRLVRQAFPHVEVVQLSAQTGEGVEAWLDAMLRRSDAGQRIIEVDYDTYAHGEAVLGWLNAAIDLEADRDIDWSTYAAGLLRTLAAEFAQRSAEIGHVKLWLSAGDGEIVGNLTRTTSEPALRGPRALRARTARLILNARVEMSPAELEQIVRESLDRTQAGTVRATIEQMRCLQPGYPTPTHRYAAVVGAV